VTGRVVAIAQHDFGSLSADEVYQVWTDPALLTRWMAEHLKEQDPAAALARIEVSAAIGGRFFFADTREGSAAWGYYKALERPKHIVFSWFVSPEEEQEDNSDVTIEITPAGAGCAVTITHEMGDEWADYVDRTAAAWRSMLQAIDVTLG
jgi:uncharacterized protein YndB with AHSA1/START domain